jgi:hypothetical protein
MRLRTLLLALLLTVGLATAASAAPKRGRVGGVVVAQGTPQLGAIVVVTPAIGPGDPLRLVTDSHGVFASTPLLPGTYTVRVRLAGFLPAFEPRVHIVTGHITLLRIELGSLFSSIEQFRRGPRPGDSPHQWEWVLRSASLTRPVLRYSGGPVFDGSEHRRETRAIHGRAEFTTGSLSSWSPVNMNPLGSTAFLYNEGLGGAGHLMLAGRVGYQDAATTGFAATWIRPTGAQGRAADSTTVIFHQSQMGTGQPAFRGVEIDSSQRLQFGNSVKLDYGAQYVFAGLNGNVSALRPQARLHVAVAPGWVASFLLGSIPEGRRAADPELALNRFPIPVESNGRLALDDAWHEEIAVRRALGSDASLTAAVFHGSDANVAVFGRGTLISTNTISDPFSNAFVYNGGSLDQWGARVGYQQKLSSHWDATLVYTSTEALAPPAADFAGASLRNMIRHERRNLLGGLLAGRIPRSGTELSAGYEWVDGPVLSRLDPFGASMFGVEPYLNVSVRQPLPSLFCCRIVALIDVRNLLAQGYVSLETADGQAILIPAARAIRGGFAVQF